MSLFKDIPIKEDRIDYTFQRSVGLLSYPLELGTIVLFSSKKTAVNKELVVKSEYVIDKIYSKFEVTSFGTSCYIGDSLTEAIEAYNKIQPINKFMKEETQHDKSLRLMDEFMTKNPEKVKEIIAKVEAMGLEGPTVEEYFESFGGYGGKDVAKAVIKELEDMITITDNEKSDDSHSEINKIIDSIQTRIDELKKQYNIL